MIILFTENGRNEFGNYGTGELNSVDIISISINKIIYYFLIVKVKQYLNYMILY